MADSIYKLECIHQSLYQDDALDEPIVISSDGPHVIGYLKSEEKAIEVMNGFTLFDLYNEHCKPEIHFLEELDAPDGHMKIYEGLTNRKDYKIIFTITKCDIT